jgi:hypothetical protein
MFLGFKCSTIYWVKLFKPLNLNYLSSCPFYGNFFNNWIFFAAVVSLTRVQNRIVENTVWKS